MPAIAGTGPGTRPHLFDSLRSFWSVLLAIVYTRLDLASVELEELGVFTARLVLVGLSAMLSLAMTVFFILFCLVALFWEERNIVLPIICGVGVLTTAGLYFFVRHLIATRPRILAQTMAELRRDVEGLNQAINPGKPSHE